MGTTVPIHSRHRSSPLAAWSPLARENGPRSPAAANTESINDQSPFIRWVELVHYQTAMAWNTLKKTLRNRSKR